MAALSPDYPYLFYCLRRCLKDDPDLQYDIGYFKRDTRRALKKQMHSYVAPSLSQLVDERAKVTLNSWKEHRNRQNFRVTPTTL